MRPLNKFTYICLLLVFVGGATLISTVYYIMYKLLGH